MAKSAFQNASSGLSSLRQIRLQPIARKASWMSSRRSSGCAGGGIGVARRSCARRPSVVCRVRSRVVSWERRSSAGCGGGGARAFPRASGRRGRRRAVSVDGVAGRGAAHRRDRIDQRDHLGDVVAVAAGQPTVSGVPRPQTIRWCLEPLPSGRPGSARSWRPPNARTCELRSPPATSRSAPPLQLRQQQLVQPLPDAASCHSRKHANRYPEPQPISCGSTPTGSPSQHEQDPAQHPRRRSACARNRAASAPSDQRSISTHSSSDTSGLAIAPHPPSRSGRSPLRNSRVPSL